MTIIYTSDVEKILHDKQSYLQEVPRNVESHVANDKEHERGNEELDDQKPRPTFQGEIHLRKGGNEDVSVDGCNCHGKSDFCDWKE